MWNLLQNLSIVRRDNVQWTLRIQSLGTGLLIRSEEKYELEWLNKHEMLCTTVILICNKMKSQNLDKKTIEDLEQNFTPKTNIKTFARKKNTYS